MSHVNMQQVQNKYHFITWKSDHHVFLRWASFSVRTALQQEDTESAHVKESADEIKERKRNQQQREKRDSDEAVLFDDGGSDVSLAGRCWTLTGHSGAGWFYRFFRLFQVREDQRCFCTRVHQDETSY